MKLLPLMAGMMLCAAFLPASAQLSEHDLNQPFGWATCSSMSSGDDYNLTGGGNGGQITLTNTGGDMYQTVLDAIKNYDVIIFDGSKGDFTISQTFLLENVKNKTVVGINGARLCTEFYVTDEIKNALDDANVKGASSTSGGGTLPNGDEVDEEREYLTRKTLIGLLDDEGEAYRKAGLFYLSGCENLIFRNIRFVGPGPIDVGGDDLVSVINGTTHCWFDHCDFTDGIDGNLDITVKSDFITVSWCTFSYTARAYDHMNTNLIGGDDNPDKQGKDNLNVTWANNLWGEGCDQRMPMARFGTIHIFNCYYNCSGNSVAINPRQSSEFLIENNYFAKGVEIFKQEDAEAYVWHDNYFEESYSPKNNGTVSVPYEYTLYEARNVAAVVSDAETGAGATLSDPLAIGEVEHEPSHIATLRSITINGTQIDLQEGIYNYSYELPANADDIVIEVATTSSRATYEITTPAADELPAEAVITVTAEDGTTTQRYTISISHEIVKPTTSKSWIFDNWNEDSPCTSNITHDGLTVIATSDKDVSFEEDNMTFDDGKSFTRYLDLKGGGRPTPKPEYRAVSFSVNAGDKVTIYNNTETKNGNRHLAISDGSKVLHSEYGNIITYTFEENGTAYVYSEANGIGIYAIILEKSAPYATTPANGSTDVDVKSHLTIDFGVEIADVDMSKIHLTPAVHGLMKSGFSGSVLNIMADTYNRSFAYATEFTVTFEEGAVTFANGESNVAFAWSFSTPPLPSGIETADDEPALTYAGTTIRSTGEQPIVVFNLQGMRVAEGMHSIDMSRMPRGIYIVRCGSEVLRIMKR